jgi:hypothetical protein
MVCSPDVFGVCSGQKSWRSQERSVGRVRGRMDEKSLVLGNGRLGRCPPNSLMIPIRSLRE